MGRGGGSVCLILHGYKSPDTGEFLFIALLGQRPALHYHSAACHPGGILISLGRRDTEYYMHVGHLSACTYLKGLLSNAHC